MADAGTPILSLPITATLLATDVIPLARPSGTTAAGADLGLTGAGLIAQLGAQAVNNLTTTTASNTTPPSIDAVNGGLALKANTADVAAQIQSITNLDASQTAAIAAAQALLSTDGNLITAITATQTAQGASIATNTQNIATNTAALVPIQKALTVGTNVGNGSQAPVQVGGYRVNVTGLESASLGGGDITITGDDAANIGGFQLLLSGRACAASAAGFSQATGELSYIAAVYGCYNKAKYSAIIANTGSTMPVGADRCAVIGGTAFTPPADVTDMVYTPRLSLFQPGGGIKMISPDGTQNAILTLSNTGQLLLNGAAIGSVAASSSAPTITNATFSAS